MPCRGGRCGGVGAPQQHNGKYAVTVGRETEVLTPPKHKDIDVQQIVDLRRMLPSAGYGAVVDELEARCQEI